LVSGAIQEVIEVALLTYFYLPWMWGKADGVAWYLAKHISWFHHNEIWGALCVITANCLSSFICASGHQIACIAWHPVGHISCFTKGESGVSIALYQYQADV